MKLLKHDILKTNISIEEICKKYNLKTEKDYYNIKSNKNICYFKRRAEKINKMIHKEKLKNF